MIIYKITNIINNKIYIGQSILTLNERISSYIKEVKYSSKNRPIIAAMKKYGFYNFVFSILEQDIFDKKILDEKERYYIQKYKTLCSESGYNVELGGNGPGKHSEETKSKISKSQLGQKNHMYGKKGELNKTSKPVIELTTGIKYGSASYAAECLNLKFSHICSVARGERGSTGGFVFRYLDERDSPIQTEKRTAIKSKETASKVLEEYKYLI